MATKPKNKKIHYKKIDNFCGLSYLTLENCPVYTDKEYGDIISLTAKEMDVLAATIIVKNMIPFRGLEISILRRALNMSYEEFARMFQISAATVFKWEKNRTAYVSLPNDLMLRLMASEKFNCDIPKDFSSISNIKPINKIVVDYKKAA